MLQIVHRWLGFPVRRARACPPEDCRGVFWYERIVEFLATGTDPDGEAADVLAEWVGDWRPDEFDLAKFQEVFDR